MSAQGNSAQLAVLQRRNSYSDAGPRPIQRSASSGNEIRGAPSPRAPALGARSRSVADVSTSADAGAPGHIREAIDNFQGCNVWMGAALADAQGDREKSKSAECISFRSLGSELVRHFAAVMKRQAEVRPLGKEELDFLGSSNRLWGGGQSPGADNPLPVVSAQSFGSFWRWFEVAFLLRPFGMLC
jgi:hypothetical protein